MPLDFRKIHIQDTIADSLERIADALERAYPKPAERSTEIVGEERALSCGCIERWRSPLYHHKREDEKFCEVHQVGTVHFRNCKKCLTMTHRKSLLNNICKTCLDKSEVALTCLHQWENVGRGTKCRNCGMTGDNDW